MVLSVALKIESTVGDSSALYKVGVWIRQQVPEAPETNDEKGALDNERFWEGTYLLFLRIDDF